VTFDPALEEALAALDWGIPIDEWYDRSKAARATMVATSRAKGVIAYYSMHEDD